MWMRFTPANPDTSHSNRHALYLSATGGGKSQLLESHIKALPVTARVVLWDRDGDHVGLHYRSRAGYLKALKAAIKRGGGFRLAYAGARTKENWEWWCEVVWSILDGRQLTYIVAEELTAVSPSVNRATPNAEVLLNESRKYGGIFWGTSQKPQAVAKTYFDQCDHKYIGRQKTARMCARMAEEIGVTPDDIRKLQPLQFYYDDGTADQCQLITCKYRKISGVKWRD